MIKIVEEGDKIYLNFDLPQGLNAEQLIEAMKQDVQYIKPYGKDVFINGRITTAMTLWLGHFLAHISKSINIFIPQENKYIKVISH